MMAAASFLFLYSCNPFQLQKEFNHKLSAQSLLSTTRYYAQGTTYLPGQTWSDDGFKKILTEKNYRIRNQDQSLMPEDAMNLDQSACESFLNATFQDKNSEPITFYCWVWKNKDSEDYQLVAIQDETIFKTFQGQPPKESKNAVFIPLLVAQYQNQQPIMQEDKNIADIPVSCLNAVIAIEDNDFLDHAGVSYTGIFRAVIKNIMSFKKAQGGSTITQQLVKNYFLTPEKTISRKLKEVYLATKLESQWTKDEILQTYLNVIYMGQSGAFQVRGFAAASQVYFNQPLENLNLAECSLLAAMINSPVNYHPWLKKENSLKRRNLVLSRMSDLKLITEEEQKDAAKVALPQTIPQKASLTAPYFFEAVQRQAEDLNIPTEGTTFFTTLNLDAQDLAQKSLIQGIQNLVQNRKKLLSKQKNSESLQGSIVSVQNQSGYVEVFVGGQNFQKTQFNRALNSRRQIGSLIKPFIYYSGLESGQFEPFTVVNDEPFTWTFDKKNWSPVNYDKKFRGPVPYYYALKESLNSPTAFIAQQIGLDKIIHNATTAGLSSEMKPLPSLSLGTSEHSATEVLQAYSTLANLGLKVPLTFIIKATNSSNEIIYENNPEPEQVLNKTKAGLLVSMMEQTVANGTAKSVGAAGFSYRAAGKTGTTSNGNDAWFAGFTPQITTVVWIGYDKSQKTKLTGASGAVPIWINYMTPIVKNFSNVDFDWPETLNKKEYEFNEVNEVVPLMAE